MNSLLISLTTLVEITKSTLRPRAKAGDQLLLGSSLSTEEVSSITTMPAHATSTCDKVISFSEVVGDVDYQIEFAIPCQMAAPLAANH